MIQNATTCLKGPKSRKSRSWKKGRANNANSASDIRHDLVARVRREIAEGSYDTPEKLEVALERLFARHIH